MIPDPFNQLFGDERIHVVDVGAADGISKRWRPVAPALHIVAFEPDSRSDTGLDSSFGAKVSVVAKAAAARSGPRPLFLTRKPRCSSLLRPNKSVNDRFPDPGRFDILGEASVECVTIDEALHSLGIKAMDFIKIDTQGTELDVLIGAERSLAGCLGAEIEVEFQPMYEGACVFRDVDEKMSSHGFELYDLRRTFFTRSAPHDPAQKKGQIIFGDALYFRNWRIVQQDHSRLIKLAIIMMVYGYVDVIAEITESNSGLSDQERAILHDLCSRLTVVDQGTRKDTFIGSGLRFTRPFGEQH